MASGTGARGEDERARRELKRRARRLALEGLDAPRALLDGVGRRLGPHGQRVMQPPLLRQLRRRAGLTNEPHPQRVVGVAQSLRHRGELHSGDQMRRHGHAGAHVGPCAPRVKLCPQALRASHGPLGPLRLLHERGQRGISLHWLLQRLDAPEQRRSREQQRHRLAVTTESDAALLKQRCHLLRAHTIEAERDQGRVQVGISAEDILERRGELALKIGGGRAVDARVGVRAHRVVLARAGLLLHLPTHMRGACSGATPTPGRHCCSSGVWAAASTSAWPVVMRRRARTATGSSEEVGSRTRAALASCLPGMCGAVLAG